MLSSFAADLLRLHRWHKHKDQLAEVLSAVKRIPGEAILKVSCHGVLNGSTCMFDWVKVDGCDQGIGPFCT